jgi:hypothetical protein
MKLILLVSSLAVMATLLIACSDDKAAPALQKQGSTALSIDTGDGSFSYKADSNGESTAVSVDTSEGKSKK